MKCRIQTFHCSYKVGAKVSELLLYRTGVAAFRYELDCLQIV